MPQTPRATPMAVPPLARGNAPVVPALAPKPLVGPIVVNCAGVEHELRAGSLLIGRLPECDVIIDETLVSRMHARVYVSHDGVTLEDLHSTNGVYLNGQRIVHAVSLNVGDRALIGSQELTFSEVRTDPAPPLSSPPPPSANVIVEPKTTPGLPLEGAAPIPITARADALELLGTLARRLANEHKAEQAPRMLGPHLKGILRGAHAGLVVPDALSLLASEYAIDLAHWTTDTSWLDYVIELHLVTKRLVPAPLIAALQRAERWVGAMDRPLLEYYVASFTPRTKELTAAEKSSLGVLRRIAKKK
jgi:pSer/pThr/pTyr-binding forkhead associated (FHA) protein